MPRTTKRALVMDNKEILEKAIQKAIDGGWKKILGKDILHFRTASDAYVKLQTNDDGMVGGEHFEINTVIFNHDFAKALWGEKRIPHRVYESPRPQDAYKIELDFVLHRTVAWQYHLQQMVIADDPIRYLGKHL